MDNWTGAFLVEILLSVVLIFNAILKNIKFKSFKNQIYFFKNNDFIFYLYLTISMFFYLAWGVMLFLLNQKNELNYLFLTGSIFFTISIQNKTS